MKQHPPQLSVVIPAYNEETNIRLGAVEKVILYLEKQAYPWELILVDDGSTDQSAALLDEIRNDDPNIRVIRKEHQGKAATVIAGILESRGEIVLFTDLDQATPIDQVEKILPWFGEGYDIVIGSRSGQRKGAPVMRLVMARGFMFLRSAILGLGAISDTQCGFKAFKRKITRELFRKLQVYRHGRRVSGSMVTAGFDIEMLFLAKKMGLRIKEVPVEWHYVDTRRVNPLKDSLQGLSDIIRIRANSLRGNYSKL